MTTRLALLNCVARRVQTSTRRSLVLYTTPKNASSSLIVVRCASAGLVGGSLLGLYSSNKTSLCLGGTTGSIDEASDLIRTPSNDGDTTESEEAIAKKKEDELQIELRSKSWQWCWREIAAHWFSFGCLALLQFVSTFLERAMGASQVQQLMQLPGQVPLDQILQQVAYIFGIKAVQLLADASRHFIAARLGARLAAQDRSIDPACPPNESGTRLVIVEAAPKLLVEAIYALFGAGAALASSPPFAAFFVAHEILAGQIIGFGAAYLGSKRDASSSLLQDLHKDRTSEFALIDADVRLNDYQNLFERYVEFGQLLGVSSFSLWASTLIDKAVIDQSTFQKVMVFATTAMQASGEIAQSVDKMNRGMHNITHLIKLQQS